MDTANPTRFAVSQNSMGVTSIVDNRKRGSGNKGVIALFFNDAQYPTQSTMYATVCAQALNTEAARRANKVAEQVLS